MEVLQVLKHAEQNNLFFVVKGFGGFAQSWESYSSQFCFMCVCAQADGKLGIVAMNGMIDGDE